MYTPSIHVIYIAGALATQAGLVAEKQRVVKK